ncbi:3-oxoacyl-ACP reductase FabG [Streptomyces lonarensis]|uniref:3-oxoacyl-ACP reductase FabG n=1 Tax=Streptomyces lonarensis TaxID=700599 RepID=A0A7X6CXM6_9ACTN|nr:3-oxoacyl-ACP reductase FabG [Streptomyces lonarensis]NJQ04355.1 3-oxoacyl-ACP reductase FabG [Streptomyces lonarensis]
MSTDRRVAVVTGAARGIGAATALRLARDGRCVAVLDLDEAECAATVAAVSEDGGTARAVGCDVTDAAAVTAAVERVTAELGPPAVLVNNAGVIRDNALFRMTEDDWDTVLAVHLRGAFLMTRACQSAMVDAGFGRIVNISSTSALGNRGQANYAAAKAGIQGFTRTVALELGRFGITANAVAPGFVATAMTAAAAERAGLTVEEFEAEVAARTAVRRIGRPEDVAGAVAYLAGDGAGYVSGQTLYVAGGPAG